MAGWDTLHSQTVACPHGLSRIGLQEPARSASWLGKHLLVKLVKAGRGIPHSQMGACPHGLSKTGLQDNPVIQWLAKQLLDHKFLTAIWGHALTRQLRKTCPQARLATTSPHTSVHDCVDHVGVQLAA